MRSFVHDAAVRFRVNGELLAQAEAKARREGMGLSEFMRAAIRDKVREAA